MTPRCALIVALARNRVIGRDGGMPWHLPDDLRYFKRVTMGKPLVMGRKTYQSIGRPLPGRTNIVVTRDTAFRPEGVEIAADLDTALAQAAGIAGKDGVDEFMVIGGGQLYAAALPHAGRLYLTEIETEIGGDTFFPEFDRADWRETARETQPACGDAPGFAFVVLDRN